MNDDTGPTNDPLNPYAAPKTESDPRAQDGLEDAARWRRLVARVIDGLLQAFIAAPLLLMMFGMGYLAESIGMDDDFELYWAMTTLSDWLALGFGYLIYAVVNGYLLAKRGQTVGKWAMKIRMVDYYTEEIPLLRFSLVIREGGLVLIPIFGLIGNIFQLIDALFIFSQNRRCLHDYWGFTKVVVADDEWVAEVQQVD